MSCYEASTHLCLVPWQHDFVNRPALCAALMLPLIKVLEAPPPKSRSHLQEYEDESDKESEVHVENRRNFKRISSVKNQAKIDRQMSEAQSELIGK